MPLRNEADRPRGRQSAKSSRPRTRSRRGTAAPRTRPPSRPAILNTQALAAPGIDWIRPLAFAARLSGPARPTGFPSTARRSHLYMCAFPDWEFVSAYAATQLHPQRTTSLRGHAPTGLHAAARSNGGRGALGPCSNFLREVPSGPPESRPHLQAFFRDRAARPKTPGLGRGTPSAFPRTHCVNIKRRARASAFAETRATFAPPR